MRGGGFHPPKLLRCPGHSGAENALSSPSSLFLVLGIPPPGSSAGLCWPGSPCDTSADFPPWPRFFSSVSPLPLAHSVSSCAPPNTQLQSPPHTPCNVPVPSVALVISRGSSPRIRIISFSNVMKIHGKKIYACQRIPGLFRRFGRFDVKGKPIGIQTHKNPVQECNCLNMSSPSRVHFIANQLRQLNQIVHLVQLTKPNF